MSKIQIFIEGKEDKKFLSDYLRYLGIMKDNVLLDHINGWTNLPHIVNKLKENTNKGGTNLLIFDADTNCDERRHQLFAQRAALGIDFELFLCPDDQNPGALEDLLIATAHPNHHAIFNCFEAYIECLRQSNQDYFLPKKKAKVYAFLEALGAETNSEKRNFLDDSCWDLNHQGLNHLRDFLIKFLG